MWECIDLFRVGADGTSAAPGTRDQPTGTDVLVFSAWDDDTFHTLYYTGSYKGTPSPRNRCTASTSVNVPSMRHNPSRTTQVAALFSAGSRKNGRRARASPPDGRV